MQTCGGKRSAIAEAAYQGLPQDASLVQKRLPYTCPESKAGEPLLQDEATSLTILD